MRLALNVPLDFIIQIKQVGKGSPQSLLFLQQEPGYRFFTAAAIQSEPRIPPREIVVIEPSKIVNLHLLTSPGVEPVDCCSPPCRKFFFVNAVLAGEVVYFLGQPDQCTKEGTFDSIFPEVETFDVLRRHALSRDDEWFVTVNQLFAILTLDLRVAIPGRELVESQRQEFRLIDVLA